MIGLFEKLKRRCEPKYEHTCESSVETTAGVTASETEAVFILFPSECKEAGHRIVPPFSTGDRSTHPRRTGERRLQLGFGQRFYRMGDGSGSEEAQR